MRINFLIIFISILSGASAYGQTFDIHGKVLDTDLEELPGINIYDQDTILLTTSDLNGDFIFTLNEPTYLIFGFIGMESETIKVSSNCDKLEIILLPDVRYHYKSHKKIDRLRKKDFDNRIKLHEQGFKKGVFTAPTPCFKYEFVPIKPVLDEIQDWMNKKKIEIRKEFNQLNIGDTVYIPYSGPRTNSVHSAYSDYTNYDCIITGTVLEKNKKRRGFNILYQVIDMEDCIYDSLTYKEKEVKVGDIIEHDMKHFRLITSSNIR